MTLTKDYKQIWYDVLYYLGGSLCYSIGIYSFAKDAGFAPGGFSGIALICNHLWNLPIGAMTLLFNIPAILVSYNVLGRGFLFKSLIAMGLCTLFLDIIFPLFPVYEGNPFLAALYSGVFIGVGLALLYMRGASSGGTDFLTLTIKVLYPHFSIGFVTLVFDLLVILLGWPVFGSINSVLYGLASTALTSLVIDKIMYGIGAGKLVIIVTNQGHAIAKRIAEISKRGSTLLNGIGTYAGASRHVLLCACTRTEIYTICSAAKEVEQGAFVMVTETSEVFGRGFIEGSVNSQAVPVRNPKRKKRKYRLASSNPSY